ncbi:MAG: bacteriochlorophyll 4-vinyl reductase, partial [Lachnospiraceae bacterium]|nr:bacteriochlorophyll 4-vinyl reductase [Lachnospiraceae bacterium]
MAEGKGGKITLEYLIEQALRIPKVKVDREEFLKAAFAKEGILVRQIVEEGPVACDYSDIELDDMADKLILRRTSESSVMSFAAGIPGGLAIAATIPADTLQFFAMSRRMAQELAYLYGAKDFWACEGEEGTLVRYQLICSLGAMFGVEGASAATRLLSSHLALRAMGGTPQRATTRAFWDP